MTSLSPTGSILTLAWSTPATCAVQTAPDTLDRTRLAPLYKVLLHNDDQTTMAFVLEVLRRVFKKDHAEAFRIMMEAHTSGLALVEVVALEVAELHVEQGRGMARGRKYPLTLTFEPA